MPILDKSVYFFINPNVIYSTRLESRPTPTCFILRRGAKLFHQGRKEWAYSTLRVSRKKLGSVLNFGMGLMREVIPRVVNGL